MVQHTVCTVSTLSMILFLQLVLLLVALGPCHAATLVVPLRRRVMHATTPRRHLLLDGAYQLHGTVKDLEYVMSDVSRVDVLCTHVVPWWGTKATHDVDRSMMLTDAITIPHTPRYFYATLELGTPPRPYDLIVDTGSTMTYVPCETCTACGTHKNQPYGPSASSTYSEVACNSDKCACGVPNCGCGRKSRVCTWGGCTVGVLLYTMHTMHTHTLHTHHALLKNNQTICTTSFHTTCVHTPCFRIQCTYERNYAESSSSKGYLVQDNLLLHGNEQGSAGLHSVPLVFGCAMSETGAIHHQAADGLLGLGNSNASVVNQVLEGWGCLRGVVEDGLGHGGVMVCGDDVCVVVVVYVHHAWTYVFAM